MSKYVRSQKGQAIIEYVFILAFMMVILVTFVRQYSSAVGRNIRSLNYVLSQFLSTGNCPRSCLMSNSGYDNPTVE